MQISICNSPYLNSITVITLLTFSYVASEEIEWNREVTLDDDFHLRWNNQDADFLIMEMSASVKGYVAVGFSPNGGMQDSDIVMGWVDPAGGAHIKDLYAEGNMTPLEDDSSDVELLLAEEHSDGRTIIRFKRRWDTCDSLHDFEISDDTVRLIWAVSDTDPIEVKGEDFKDHFIFPYHGPDFRGTKSLLLKVDKSQIQFPDDLDEPDMHTYFWDVTMENAPISGESDTSYHCRIFKTPDFTQDPNVKHQIIGYRPLLDEENEQWVHHINLFECHVPKSVGWSGDVFEKYLGQPGEQCYTKNMPPEWAQYCITFPITWAIGAEGLMLPDHGGFPMWEEHNGTTYFMLEIHYDNPKMLKFEDNSGIRVFITDKPRQNDYSQISIHNRFGQFQLIPPRSSRFKTAAFCTPECTAAALPREGITVTHALLHGHLTAKSITTRHIRNGIELPPIAQDNSYQFDYQQMRSVNPPRKVYPGDILMTECIYDTTDRDNITFGGTSTRDEMCQSLVTYYPKVPLALCKTQPEFHNFFHVLGIHRVEGEKALEKLQLPYKPSPDQKFDPGDDAYVLKNGISGEPEYPFDMLKVGDPISGRGPPLTVRQFLDNINWRGQNFTARVWEEWWQGKQLALCTGHSHIRIPLKDYYVNYPEFVPYEKPKSAWCSHMKNKHGTSGQPGTISLQYFYAAFLSVTLLAIYR